MRNLEWTFVEKRTWERGPWDKEPDKAQWKDPATGFPCLILRNHSGALCGYVGVPPEHPWHGEGYNDVKTHEGEYVEVHGGLTFSGSCQEDNKVHGICHLVDAASPPIWWQGFDCAHAMDYSPGMAAVLKAVRENPKDAKDIGHEPKDPNPEARPLREGVAEGPIQPLLPFAKDMHNLGHMKDVYRDLNYVAQECRELARQAQEVMPWPG